MTTTLNTLAFKAHTHPKHRFQNLYGLLDAASLYESWGQLNKLASPGIDGITMPKYKSTLIENIERLSQQLKQKSYRANDIKRIYIPKSNGKERPLGLPTVDDKLVQQSVSQILQSIWEQDFMRNSYGYRPNKSAHQAVHSLTMNLQFKGYGYIVEADIKGFFDNLEHEWLMKMLALRIDDKAILNLINQWLKARIKSPDGVFTKPSSGSPQGGIISPVLANIYLHYALDLWFEKKVKPRMRGRAMMIRYADDFVCAFQFANDAERFYKVLPKRLKKFNLDVAQDKTSLMRFSRFHVGRKRHFVFLGFEFYWGTDSNDKPRLRRRTAAKKQKTTLSEYYQWIKARYSLKLKNWLPQLRRKLIGFRNYFGLPDNSRSLSTIYDYVLHSLYKWLNRRSGRRSYSWSNFKKMIEYFNIESIKVSKRNILVDWY
ncbi:group II intron reverse transcriptase/maturase [Pseudoalteromonas aliena]|uniref:Group II intron reverse transcriptase/maturase n=1 Tax=Pseudoalteromonas aliena TaxID=247523 RepID=A0A1Q2GUR6_9GAMM|nr:group II intron reverse transcriptase/maturase [Pseudoalteromonas aliena]AQP98864.1 group II intron reverse transcriptase/maturase [Pseudoalteromonas aliena]AQP98868.1 group II intron reverse transcriptase/maturase [Pseudoalteromonas aliena]AQQ00769.1 group II intron reverse transcriptase/maturase [Pseudoalteromonas aliena]AQQ01338.1 group II intron reverse transcriptase/maturase [Pseudoalteromonas aliena]